MVPVVRAVGARVVRVPVAIAVRVPAVVSAVVAVAPVGAAVVVVTAAAPVARVRARPAADPVVPVAVLVVAVAVVPVAVPADLRSVARVDAVAPVVRNSDGARSGVATETNSNRRRSGFRPRTRRFPKAKSWCRAASRSKSSHPS